MLEYDGEALEGGGGTLEHVGKARRNLTTNWPTLRRFQGDAFKVVSCVVSHGKGGREKKLCGSHLGKDESKVYTARVRWVLSPLTSESRDSSKRLVWNTC